MKKILLALSLLSLTAISYAEIVVKDAWVRATVPQQKATGAFMQIRSTKDVSLVEVQTSAAGMAEVHEMKMESNVMKMRALPQLNIDAGKLVELKPGSFHIMLMDLKAQAKPGETIPLTLVFEGKDKKRELIEVKAVVKSMMATEGRM